MNVSIILGPFEGDDRIEVEVSDDTAFTPEVCSDLLRRAADTAIRLHGEMHPAS